MYDSYPLYSDDALVVRIIPIIYLVKPRAISYFVIILWHNFNTLKKVFF